MTKEQIKTLEANFLDGDKIDDCGGCIHSISGVIDIVDFFLKKETKKYLKKIEELEDEIMELHEQREVYD